MAAQLNIALAIFKTSMLIDTQHAQDTSNRVY